MVYLDYSKTCPISFEALDTYTKASKEYIGDYSASNKLGMKALNSLKQCTKEIADLFNIMESEITFTSGATEANNLALIGVAMANHKKGKHIIVSKLEDAGMYQICDYLSSIGFEISYVENDEDGLVDFEDLKRLVKEDTILVSISAVNNAMGIRQPLKMIRQIIKKENPNVLLHSDVSQGIGKIGINFHDVDLASVSSHKIFGPKSIGFLYCNDIVNIAPLMYGTKSLNVYQVSVPLVLAFATALKNALNDLEKKEHFISRLNEKIVNSLESYNDIQINKTKYSIAHILNLSLPNNSAGLIEKYLSEKDICVGYEEGLNTTVMAVYQDKKRASSTVRISLSYKTTTDEIKEFIVQFIKAYEQYGK